MSSFIFQDDKEHLLELTQLVEAGVTPHYAFENMLNLILQFRSILYILTRLSRLTLSTG